MQARITSLALRKDTPTDLVEYFPRKNCNFRICDLRPQLVFDEGVLQGRSWSIHRLRHLSPADVRFGGQGKQSFNVVRYVFEHGKP